MIGRAVNFAVIASEAKQSRATRDGRKSWIASSPFGLLAMTGAGDGAASRLWLLSFRSR